MLKKRKSKRMSANGSDVNITSLLDVLTVLLFFLIKSSTVSSLQLSPPEGVVLPNAIVAEEAKEAIKIAVSHTALMVNSEVMMKIDNKGRFPAGELAEDQRTIKPLQEFLRAEYQKKKDFYKGVAKEGDPNIPAPTLLIQADHKLPFGTIKYILHTAAISGFGDYQFVVQGEQD